MPGAMDLVVELSHVGWVHWMPREQLPHDFRAALFRRACDGLTLHDVLLLYRGREALQQVHNLAPDSVEWPRGFAYVVAHHHDNALKLTPSTREPRPRNDQEWIQSGPPIHPAIRLDGDKTVWRTSYFGGGRVELRRTRLCCPLSANHDGSVGHSVAGHAAPRRQCPP